MSKTFIQFWPKIYFSTFSLFLLICNPSLGQAPFDIKSKFTSLNDSSYDVMAGKVRKQGKQQLELRLSNKSININSPELKNENIAAFNENLENTEKRVDVLNQYSGGLVVDDATNKLFPTINGNIITYRLNLWTKTNTNGTTTRHYLPLSIITKVSGSSQNNTGTLNDATSFFGAPLTFRLSPVFFDKQVGGENRVVVGMHHDLRLITVGDTATSKIQSAFGYYGAFGTTYFGVGDVTDPGDNTTYDGSWSFSALVYLFTSGGTFNHAVFGDYKANTLTGFELLFKFDVINTKVTKFNLLIGGNYGLTRGAPNFGSWQFKLGIGN